MSFDAERLAELLPAVYRVRDAEQGGPLAALLEVIGEEIGVVEAGLDQLYEDQFVETAAPWVLPYVGELLGVTGLPPAPLPARGEVAHTIAYRRRKGTAAVLEQLARDVTGLAARADESFELLCTTQYVNHLRPYARGVLSLLNARRLERVGSPFERLAGETTICHTADVRRIARGRGRYNIPNVGVFLWRLRANRLTRSPAVAAAASDRQRFRFSPLGNDAPLFNRPQTERALTHLAEPLDVPERISRRAFAAARDDYYGADASILVELPGASPAARPSPVPSSAVVVCDLSGWDGAGFPSLPAGRVAIDPVLGRLAFASPQANDPLVTFHYGFPAPIAGGEYERSPAGGDAEVLRVTPTDPAGAYATIQEAIDDLPPGGGVVEVADSGRYDDPFVLDATGGRITVRAAVGARPTIVLAADLAVRGGAADAVLLDGLIVTGGGLHVRAGAAGDGIGRVLIRNCTVVPGITLDANGAPQQSGPSVRVESANTEMEIERSVVGRLASVLDARVHISDSIVDATDPTLVAFGPLTASGDFGGTLVLERATVIGRVRTDLLELASNAIFLASPPTTGTADPTPVAARRRQEGCLRFSYVPAGSRTPRRHRCQPASERDDARVRPLLTSTRYGHPAYCQLADASPAEIRRGADDEGELGAYHLLQLPRREAHLRARLDEYLRFGLEAGVLHAT